LDSRSGQYHICKTASASTAISLLKKLTNLDSAVQKKDKQSLIQHHVPLDFSSQRSFFLSPAQEKKGMNGDSFIYNFSCAPLAFNGFNKSVVAM